MPSLHHLPAASLLAASRRPSQTSRSTLASAVPALAILLALAGCSALQPSGPQRPGTSTAPAGPTTPEGKPRAVQICNAQPVQSYVGKPNTAPTLEAARKQSGAYMARVLGQNQPTTMEFNQERLNLIVDSAGKIVAVRCG